MPKLTIVLDKHLSAARFANVLPSAMFLPASEHLPHLPYLGRYADDEDHAHVLQLAWENDATCLTCDSKMIAKAQDFNRCGSFGHYLNGVIVFPVGEARQVECFSRFVSGTLTVMNIDADDSLLDAVRDNNLGVDLSVKQPTAVELCGCLWLDEVERNHRRYKRK